MIYDKLYGFQKEAVDKLLTWGRGLLADEMGLGKSIQCLALLEKLVRSAPDLRGKIALVVPAYLKGSWRAEMEKWCFNIPVELCSYAHVARHPFATAPQVLVLDESHYIKNRKSKRYQALRRLRPRHVFLMTGTPTPSRLEELFCQLSMIDRTLRYWPWVKRYCAARESFFGWDVSGVSHVAELREYLETKMVRRKKETVVDLPEKIYSVLPVPVKSLEQEKLHRRWLEINKKLETQEDSRLDFERKQIVSSLYLMSAQSKVEVVRRLVRDLYDAGETFLLFAFHRCLLDAVDVPHIRIDGDTKDRMALVEEFQEGKKRVAALSIRAAGTGLTLTRATKVIFAELTFSPGEMEQACARAHRIGQKNAVNIYYLLSTKLDKWMYQKLLRKEKKLFL